MCIRDSLITIPVNLAGLCALSMPMGFSQVSGTDLPCGLQVIGKPFDENTVLRLGYSIERAIEEEIRSKMGHMRRGLGLAREAELVD